MNRDRWRDVSRIYGAVLTKLPEARDAFLRDARKDDEELRREVELLLKESVGGAVLDRGVSEQSLMMNATSPVRIGSHLGVFRIDALLGVGDLWGFNERTHDIGLDDQHFLMVKRTPPGSGAVAAQINVVVNWFTELQQRVPTR